MPSATPTLMPPHDPAANVARSMVYFATLDYRLKKLRAEDGSVVWNRDIGPVVAGLPNWNVVLSAGAVVVEKFDLFAFDTTTGAPLWTYIAPDADETGYFPVVADDSTIYAGSRLGRAYAINAGTGQARWIHDLTNGDTGVTASAPTLSGGVLYLCSHTTSPPVYGTLWALNAATGDSLWAYRFAPEHPEQDAACFGYPAVTGDIVVQPEFDGRVYAFDRTTGSVRWVAPHVHVLPHTDPKTGFLVGSWDDERFAAASGPDLVVTSSSSTSTDNPWIVSLDPATGAERWRAALPGAPLTLPVIWDSTLYLGYVSQYAAYRLTDGAQSWLYPQVLAPGETGPLQGRPVAGSDRLFFGGRDGSYAVRK